MACVAFPCYDAATAKSRRCDRREKHLAEKRKALAQSTANQPWRLRSQEASKPHRAARTSLRSSLAKDVIQTAADIPRICSCDRFRPRKPRVGRLLAVQHDLGHDCGSQIPISLDSIDELMRVLESFDSSTYSTGYSTSSDCLSADDRSSDSSVNEELQSLADQSVKNDFELLPDSLELDSADGESDWNLV